MKIIQLQAENVKRLRAIEITPEGSTVVIAGRNGQGKTSVLDSIWFALGGGNATRETSRPIRDGEDHASVRLDLGSLVVTRKWSKETGKTTLTVDSPDGARFRSPQAMLDDLVGRLSFDPLGFSQLPDREQRATLLDLIELPFDPEMLERDRAGIFDGRTEVNRQLRALEAQLAAMPDPPEDLPDEEISSAAVLADYQAAQEQVRKNDRDRAAVSEAQRRADESKAAVQLLEQQVEDARKRAKKYAVAADDLSEQVSTLEDPSLDGFEERLASLEATNQAVRAAHARSRVLAEVSEVRGSSEALTAKLDAIEKQKRDAIEAAKMPIDGLAFDAEGVLYQGVPFKQSSAAEQLRVSLAMAMSLNPSIRVIRITDGSLLDSENMALIEEMATDNDYQVWIERVDETGKIGITIEDGAVVEAEPVDPIRGPMVVPDPKGGPGAVVDR